MFGLDFLPLATRQMLLTGQTTNTPSNSASFFGSATGSAQLPAHLAHLPSLSLGALQSLQSLQTSPAALQQLDQFYQGGDNKQFDVLLQDAAQRALLLSRFTSPISSGGAQAGPVAPSGGAAGGETASSERSVSEEEGYNKNDDEDANLDSYSATKQRHIVDSKQVSSAKLEALQTAANTRDSLCRTDGAEDEIDVEFSDSENDDPQTE